MPLISSTLSFWYTGWNLYIKSVFMKEVTLNLPKTVAILAFLFSAVLVKAMPAYTTADAIKKIMSYKVSASSVATRTVAEAKERAAMAARAAKKA